MARLGIVQDMKTGEVYAAQFVGSDYGLARAAGPIDEPIFDEEGNPVESWREMVEGWLANHSDSGKDLAGWLEYRHLDLRAEA